MPENLTLDTLDLDAIRQIVREEIQLAFKKDPASRKACFIASKGTLDWAYPPLILSTTRPRPRTWSRRSSSPSTASTSSARISRRSCGSRPVANPAMPMPVPMPDIVTSMPGMTAMATKMMKSMFSKKGVATIRELLDAARESGVRLIACQMTMDVFGYQREDFIEGVEFGGAAAFLSEARKAHVTLFI